MWERLASKRIFLSWKFRAHMSVQIGLILFPFLPEFPCTTKKQRWLFHENQLLSFKNTWSVRLDAFIVFLLSPSLFDTTFLRFLGPFHTLASGEKNKNFMQSSRDVFFFSPPLRHQKKHSPKRQHLSSTTGLAELRFCIFDILAFHGQSIDRFNHLRWSLGPQAAWCLLGGVKHHWIFLLKSTALKINMELQNRCFVDIFLIPKGSSFRFHGSFRQGKWMDSVHLEVVFQGQKDVGKNAVDGGNPTQPPGM